MKAKIVLLGITLSLLAIGCNSKDAITTMTAEEATISSKLDIITDDVSKIVENQLTSEDGISGKSAATVSPYLPECATVTRVPDYGTPITAGTQITKTIDFGTTGCPLPNGNSLKGKIIMTFTYEPDATSHTITYTFDNFYHNSIKIDGERTFTRVMGTSTANPESHPIVTMNMDLMATLPNGSVATRVGSRIREITAGYGTSEWNDNVYQITGSWITTLPNASIQTSTITSPLIVNMNCPHIVQGIITIVRNNNTATLDYGDGTCDAIAIFTLNGVPHPINL